MAAWSNHEEWAEIPVSRAVKAMESVSTPEPFPTEVWTFFSDSDLDQLVIDACTEMGRRAGVKRGDRA